MNDLKLERAMISREAKVASAVDELWSKINLLRPVMTEIIAKTHELDENKELRDDLTWYNVMECVRQELYPAMAASMSQALDELVVKSRFDIGDLGGKAVERVIEGLKTKKVLFNKEIEYIRDLVQRARAFKWEKSESMFLCHSLFPIQFNHSGHSATLH